MIELRAARRRDYDFARDLYVQTLKPYASAWAPWTEKEKEREFTALWRPKDTSIILCDLEEVGWRSGRQKARSSSSSCLWLPLTRDRASARVSYGG